MAWFHYNERITTDIINLNTELSKHIIKSLRMRIGEKVTICDINKNQYSCEIKSIDVNINQVELKVLDSIVCKNEATIKVTVYQALTKGDKMDYIIQKGVELGVYNIVPILTDRCVSRPDKNTLKKKQTRWQKIAKGAAEQSKRGIIPKIEDAVTLKESMKDINKYDRVIVFYENGGEKIKDIVEARDENIAIFIGSEGGFEEEEIVKLEKANAKRATLGKRILRTETASIVALTIIMNETNNM